MIEDKFMPFQKICMMTLYLNILEKTQKLPLNIIGKNFEVSIKIKIDDVMKSLSRNTPKLVFSVENNVIKNGEMKLSIEVEFKSIYENLIFQKEVIKIAEKLKELLSNQVTTLPDGTIIKSSIKSYKIPDALTTLYLFEKAQADSIKTDENYLPFQRKEELLDFFSEKLDREFYFISSHRKIVFPEIDFKLMEARYCIANGLSLSAISILCVLVEETLKTLLKTKLFRTKQSQITSSINLTIIMELTREVEKEYGSLVISRLIISAYNEGIINEAEKNKFEKLRKFRNAHLHSDTSGIFPSEPKEVSLVELVDNEIKLSDQQKVPIGDIFLIQGFAKKFAADINVKEVFYEIEDLVFNLCQRNQPFID